MPWTDRYLDLAAGSNGSGTSSGSPWNSWANAVTGLGTVSAATRVFVKGSASLSTTLVTLNNAGTSVSIPLWWCGCDADWNDLGDAPNADKPTTTFTTGNFVVSSTANYFTNLSWTSAAVTGTNPGTVCVTVNGYVRFDRCRFENTAANSNGNALRFSGSFNMVSASWLKATSSSPAFWQGGASAILGCYVEGGSNGVFINGQRGVVVGNVIESAGSHGVYLNDEWQNVIGNTIHGCGGSGVWVQWSDNGSLVANNLFVGNGGWGLGSAAPRAAPYAINNAYRANTSGQANTVEGFQVRPVTEPGDPFAHPAGDDFTLSPSALSRVGGVPGRFENKALAGWLACGAVQPFPFAPSPRTRPARSTRA